MFQLVDSFSVCCQIFGLFMKKVFQDVKINRLLDEFWGNYVGGQHAIIFEVELLKFGAFSVFNYEEKHGELHLSESECFFKGLKGGNGSFLPD